MRSRCTMPSSPTGRATCSRLRSRMRSTSTLAAAQDARPDGEGAAALDLAEMPGYASVLVMYAFALEENGQYRRAERIAQQALTLDPGIPAPFTSSRMSWKCRVGSMMALHFLPRSNWPGAKAPDYPFILPGIAHCSIWMRMIPRALSLSTMRRSHVRVARTFLALADGSALLWRLKLLQGVDLGEHWRLLADRWARHNLANARLFYLLHAMMAFVAAERPAAAMRIAEALPVSNGSEASSLPPEDALAAPLCEALFAFARNDYAVCVEWLQRVRRIAHRCGGSLAQCDVIDLTLTEAALRARKARLARALVAERTARKPASRLNRSLQQRLGMQPREYEWRAGATAALLP